MPFSFFDSIRGGFRSSSTSRPSPTDDIDSVENRNEEWEEQEKQKEQKQSEAQVERELQLDGMEENKMIGSSSTATRTMPKRKAKRILPPKESKLSEEDDDDPPSTSASASTSKRHRPFEKGDICHLNDLPPGAAKIAKDISTTLGGEQWKSQSIGMLGPIPSRSEHTINPLRTLAETSVKLSGAYKLKNGFFPPDAVDAMVAAYQHRQDQSRAGAGRSSYKLGKADYVKANELLEEKLKLEKTRNDNALD